MAVAVTVTISPVTPTGVNIVYRRVFSDVASLCYLFCDSSAWQRWTVVMNAVCWCCPSSIRAAFHICAEFVVGTERHTDCLNHCNNVFTSRHCFLWRIVFAGVFLDRLQTSWCCILQSVVGLCGMYSGAVMPCLYSGFSVLCWHIQALQLSAKAAALGRSLFMSCVPCAQELGCWVFHLCFSSWLLGMLCSTTSHDIKANHLRHSE